jgi:hypothetical protein
MRSDSPDSAPELEVELLTLQRNKLQAMVPGTVPHPQKNRVPIEEEYPPSKKRIPCVRSLHYPLYVFEPN